MYCVCALVAAACLLVQNAQANLPDKHLVTKERGILPGHYKKSENVTIGPMEQHYIVNIVQLFDLRQNDEVITVKLEVLDTSPPSLELEISENLRTASVRRLKPPGSTDGDVLTVSIHDVPVDDPLK